MSLISNVLSKLFGGNKYEKDVKAITPIIEQVKAAYAPLSALSNDKLRNKTAEFKSRIAEHLKQIDAEIAALRTEADDPNLLDVDRKDDIYKDIDKLRKDRDKKIEEVLMMILPEAFAVMKETARRFTENDKIISTATAMDRDLSVNHDFVQIEGNNAIYSNEWTAAGVPIKWNMVHYDVQLIGGYV